MQPEIALFWFRRDLRVEDNHALFKALSSGLPVLPLFIFDTNILNELSDRQDARVHFIHEHVQKLHRIFEANDSTLLTRIGKPATVFKQLFSEYKVKAIYANEDYEPYAMERDEIIAEIAKLNSATLYTFKDHVVFAKNEIVKSDGSPYAKFTPYSQKWKSEYHARPLPSFDSEKKLMALLRNVSANIPSLEEIGFSASEILFPPSKVSNEILQDYASHRDIPGQPGTSRLGVHLRFGTISIRQLCKRVEKLSGKYFDELIWRDFYQMILWFHPQVVFRCFRPEFDKMIWRNNESEFTAWCEGKTGYPIVDAGMRELNATGFMHNRVRMITASFLTKHLLIDWRWGEAYFASKLLDYDLAANNGGWQWAAGSGCDAMPYFRFFNPSLQEQKFDPERKYIRQWIPEIDTPEYPGPIVAHELARERGLQAFKNCR